MREARTDQASEESGYERLADGRLIGQPAIETALRPCWRLRAVLWVGRLEGMAGAR